MIGVLAWMIVTPRVEVVLKGQCINRQSLSHNLIIMSKKELELCSQISSSDESRCV